MIVSFEGFLCCVRAKFLSLFVLECSGARKIAFRIDFRRFSIWRLYLVNFMYVLVTFRTFSIRFDNKNAIFYKKEKNGHFKKREMNFFLFL